MFSKYLFLFCALMLFTAVIGSAAVEAHAELEEEGALEDRNPLLAVAIRVITEAVKWAAKHCVKEAANHCKHDWKNPKKLVNCAKNFLQKNKGRCVTG